MSKSNKKFIGGIVCGLLVGSLIGGYTMACVLGTAFISFALKEKPVTFISQLK